MKRILALAILLTTFAFPAFALDLHTARSSGLVGEKSDGYAAVIGNSSDAQALVNEVNGKRQQEYARISKQNGQPVDVVAKLAAVEIIKNLPAGSKYQGSDGSWKTR
ncbi:MAG: DUF1318 domain-containing protein [Proteobacteria bacterium]|nr:DUF1318 domain-containing protein [Pseudomonadota bacterium]